MKHGETNGELRTSIISYEPNTALDQAAEQLSSDIRHILQRTSGHREMRTYINYAFGNETFPELYGSEERVARLQGLKREYDPQNVFRFFGPPGGFEI
jgi:FAD/FMN-containing dehydrogenase